MTIRYQRDGSRLIYECNQAHTQLAAKTCQTMRGDRIDQAVVQCFLEAIQPAHLEVASRALDPLEARARQVDQQWQRHIERAQYEADLARRRYRAVDPDNRLVARSLEREWNEKLAEVDQLEREYALLPKQAALLLTAAQREQIRALAHDLPAIWHAPTTTFAQRKQLVRWLIKDVTLSKRGNVIDVAIRWQTEALTRLAIPRYKMSWEERQTSPQVVERVRELAPTHTNAQIAALLNEEGERAGMGGSFTVSKIEWIRYAYHIPLDAQSVRKLPQPGSGGMGAIRLAPPQNCSTSMSRRSPTGAKPGSWRVFAPRLWGHVGLPSRLRSLRAAQADQTALETATHSKCSVNMWYSNDYDGGSAAPIHQEDNTWNPEHRLEKKGSVQPISEFPTDASCRFSWGCIFAAAVGDGNPVAAASRWR